MISFIKKVTSFLMSFTFPLSNVKVHVFNNSVYGLEFRQEVGDKLRQEITKFGNEYYGIEKVFVPLDIISVDDVKRQDEDILLNYAMFDRTLHRVIIRVHYKKPHRSPMELICNFSIESIST